MSAAPQLAQDTAPATSLSNARSEPAPVLQRLIDAGVLRQKQRVLVYGCGRGADVAWLRVRKFDVSGYDPYPPFGYTAPPEGRYDAVLLIYLMTRLKTDERRCEALRDAAARVRPGGALVVASRSWQRYCSGEDASFESAKRGLQSLFSGFAFQDFGFLPEPELNNDICGYARFGGTHEPQLPWEWVEDDGRAAEICAALAKRPLIGLDVETTLEEPRELCTVQLSDGESTYILDMCALSDWSPVKALMENERVIKVIHNAFFEEQMFGRYSIRIRGIYDTLIESRKRAKPNLLGGHKLAEVCERTLGLYLDKSEQTSDWTQRPLSERQLAYAALDAEVLIQLHRAFNPPPPPCNLELF